MAQGLGLKPHCLEDDLLDAYPLESTSHHTEECVPCSLEAWLVECGLIIGACLCVIAGGQWSSSILSSIHYQASQQRVQAGVERVMAPSHVDRGVLTLVYSDTPGLQVWTRRGTC
jgi:hypothetical protein